MDALIQFFLDHGVTSGVILLLSLLVFFFVRLTFDPDEGDIFRARAYKALVAFTNRREHEKKFISNDIRGRLNLARRGLHFGAAVLPSAVSVEWVETENPTSYEVREGQFIVRLDPRQDQAHNTVIMAQTIVKRTALEGIRHLTEASIATAIDLTLVKKLLRQIGRHDALELFYAKFYEPRQGGELDKGAWLSKVADIDDQGLFERLLLVELEDFSRRIFHLDPRPYMIGEVEGLVRWIHLNATRRERVDAPLNYIRAHIKVGIILVGRVEKIIDRGIAPYLEALRICVEQRRMDAIYLIIWEKPHVGSTGIRRVYAERCRELRAEMRRQPGVQEHFHTPYECVDPNGYRRVGEISRFIIAQEVAPLEVVERMAPSLAQEPPAGSSKSSKNVPAS